ncbi:hypothetical protein AtEden1_Chr2g0239561 [Arabidopsis thaliana]|uniref:Uncharacterized protein n=1 Tax=Arabidopsis thaliana TaxID=3702 RepID=A0A5S9X056_ARATH|nr:unnamed protein product [Arabidopsis thaliana]
MECMEMQSGWDQGFYFDLKKIEGVCRYFQELCQRAFWSVRGAGATLPTETTLLIQFIGVHICSKISLHM